ncbi:MAG: ABC transporter permease, partial [Actinomycetota bacterium]
TGSLPVGEGAHGYKAVTFHGVGSDFPIFDDIHEFVVDRGLAAGAGDQVGTVLYNRGVYAAMLAAEAARTAQEIHGVADITGAMMRDGMEALTLDNDRLAELGLGGFGPEIAVSCENHGGPGLGAIAQWDAINARWIQISDFGPANRSVVDPLIEADAMAFAAESNITPRDCAAE